MQNSSNALIPFGLQADCAMPGASEDKEFRYAQQMTQSLLSSAQHIKLSFPSVTDGVASQLSPIVADCLNKRAQQHGEFLIAQSSGATPADTSPRAPADVPNQYWSPFEYLDDFYGQAYPALFDEERRPILRRGIAMLQDYAINPLRAYARHRLLLEPLPRPNMGLSALERGNVVHAALEYCWRELQTGKALREVSAAGLTALVERGVSRHNSQITVVRMLCIGSEHRLSPLCKI